MRGHKQIYNHVIAVRNEAISTLANQIVRCNYRAEIASFLAMTR